MIPVALITGVYQCDVDNTCRTIRDAWQTPYPHKELVVIDSSPERTAEIENLVHELGGKYLWCLGHNVYYAGVIHEGLANSAAPYIAYFSSNRGKKIKDTWLQELTAPLADSRIGITGSLQPCDYRPICMADEQGFHHHHIQGGVWAMRREVAEAHPISPYFPQCYSDVWLSWRLQKEGFKLGNVPTIAAIASGTIPDPQNYSYVVDYPDGPTDHYLMRDDDPLALKFRRRGPWVTRFDINGNTYGGNYNPDDHRLAAFRERFPAPKKVLELGALEGGHTFLLEASGYDVLAVEGRSRSIRNAEFVREILGRHSRFVHMDLERSLPDGKFDVIFAVGVLYHFLNPLDVLKRCAKAAPSLFLWTHHWDTGLSKLGEPGYYNGLKGFWYREFGPNDACSGLKERSFWPTMDSLKKMLSWAGYRKIEILKSDEHDGKKSAILTASVSD